MQNGHFWTQDEAHDFGLQESSAGCAKPVWEGKRKGKPFLVRNGGMQAEGLAHPGPEGGRIVCASRHPPRRLEGWRLGSRSQWELVEAKGTWRLGDLEVEASESWLKPGVLEA